MLSECILKSIITQLERMEIILSTNLRHYPILDINDKGYCINITGMRAKNY